MKETFEMWFRKLFILAIQFNVEIRENEVDLKWMFEDNLTPEEALMEAMEQERKF